MDVQGSCVLVGIGVGVWDVATRGSDARHAGEGHGDLLGEEDGDFTDTGEGLDAAVLADGGGVLESAVVLVENSSHRPCGH